MVALKKCILKISHKIYLHVAPKRPSVWQIFCGKQSILVHELIGRALNICHSIFLLKKLNMGGFAKFFFFFLRYSRKTKRKINKLMIKVTKVLFEYCSKIASTTRTHTFRSFKRKSLRKRKS